MNRFGELCRRLKVPLAAVGVVLAALACWNARAELFSENADWLSPALQALWAWPVALPLAVLPTVAASAALLRPARQGATLAGVFVFAGVIAAALLAGGDSGKAAARLACGGVALLIFIAATALGARLLNWFKLAENFSPLEAIALACGMGLAALSTLTLLLGLAGWVSRWTLLATLTAMLASGAGPLPGLLRCAAREAEEFAVKLSAPGWVMLGLLAAAAALLAPAVFAPPLDYDVLEYHLQLPREYLELGRVAFLPHNTFSGFPQGMEMLSYLALALTGCGETPGAAYGVWLAQAVNFLFLPLTLAAVFLAVRRFSGARGAEGGLAAACLVAACPLFISLPFVLYVELGMAAYAALALLCLAEVGGARFWRVAALCGIFAGASCCCKYTGLIFVGAPAAVAACCLAPAGTKLRRRAAGAALCGLCCWFALSPWLIKNFHATGNPVYPLWNAALGVRGWSAEQESRFRAAHRPEYQRLGEATFSARELARSAWRLLVGGDRELLGGRVEGKELGALALLFLPGLLLAGARERRAAWLLAAWAAACMLCWFFLTHRLERFFHLGYMLLACLSGLGYACLARCVDGDAENAPARWAAPALLLPAALGALGLAAYIGSYYLRPAAGEGGKSYLALLEGELAPEEYLRAAPMFRLREYLLHAESPGGALLLVGSADPFWLPPRTDYRYAVVFAEHPFFAALRQARTGAELAARLRATGVDQVYFDWPELARLSCTYYRAYELSPEKQRVLRDFLTNRICRLALPSPRWKINCAGGWTSGLVERNPELFPADGFIPYGISPYELYSIR